MSEPLVRLRDVEVVSVLPGFDCSMLVLLPGFDDSVELPGFD